MAQNELEKKKKLMQLVLEVIAKDQALRDQYGIGEKFRFIRDKLHGLVPYLEAEMAAIAAAEKAKLTVQEDEQIVYVYLFNSSGVSLPTWRKMVHESVFYEYSINRPIYVEQSQIDSFIRSRSNRLQHAYLSVIIKKNAVIPNVVLKDAHGNPLIKVKEGALKRDKLLAFTHGDHVYEVTLEGDFLKQE